ncbi:MAG: hypothetical protein ACE3JN_07990 [Ectobacillus sp.]
MLIGNERRPRSRKASACSGKSSLTEPIFLGREKREKDIACRWHGFIVPCVLRNERARSIYENERRCANKRNTWLC